MLFRSFDQRVQAVQAFRALPEAKTLAAANKRVSNLLGKNSTEYLTTVQAHHFDSPTEFALYAALKQAQQAVAPLTANRQYTEILARLASLNAPVDAFFIAVMVNADNPDVRANRYALLAQLHALFLGVADISVLD